VGIVIEPQIHAVINDDLFEHLFLETEKSAWLKFKEVRLNFLGNVKAEKYEELVQDLLNAYQTRGRNMLFEDSLLTFQIGLLLSESGGSEQQFRECSARIFYVSVSVHHKSILYKEPTRCNFGSVVY
jgi:hypothetical protein